MEISSERLQNLKYQNVEMQWTESSCEGNEKKIWFVLVTGHEAQWSCFTVRNVLKKQSLNIFPKSKVECSKFVEHYENQRIELNFHAKAKAEQNWTFS